MKKQLLFFMLTFFSPVIFSQTPPSYIPTNGLIGWWPFNGNANDESGNANNGTVYGAILTSDRFSNTSSAYDFNGTSDYIKVNPSTGNFLTSDFTLSAWVYDTDTADGGALISKRDADTHGNYFTLAWLNNGGFELNESNASDYLTGLLPGDSTNQWHNIVLIRDSTIFSLYLDGFFLQSYTSPVVQSINNNVDLTFGARYYLSSSTIVENIHAKIDDIGIWNRALLPSEVSQIYYGPTAAIKILKSGNPIEIYPNPSNDFVFIKSNKNISGQKYFITDCFGRQVLSGQFSNENSRIDLSSFAAGIYFLEINQQIIKVVKK